MSNNAETPPIDELVAQELLMRGLDDWVQLPEAWYVARELGAPADDQRFTALSAIARLLREGLIVAGDLREGRGYLPRPGGSVDAIARVEQLWPSGPERPQPSGTGWLCNTPAGDEAARALINARHTDAGETTP